MRVLHAATECFPYVKAGGLGDVLGALPKALRDAGTDTRLLLPGYPALLERLDPLREVAGTWPEGMRLLAGRTDSGVPVYLADSSFFNRPGGPYDEWGDSALRFAAFSQTIAALGQQGDDHGWRPEVLNLHDWQTGLAPVYLDLAGGPRPRTVLTIHNLAYQGRYSRDVLPLLGIPERLFHPEGVEFYGDLSFLKAGLQHADRLTTVSPTYAREIQTPAFGERLEGLLSHRSGDLVGILNGVDESIWTPAHSPHLSAHYSRVRPSGKKVCKNQLQRELDLAEAPFDPLFGVVSRLTDQKGLDLLLEQVDALVAEGAQLVVLGTGDPVLEAGFAQAAQRHPGRVAAAFTYSEPLSHRLIAGCDALLVPSRFEPCGLTQMYALAYGTLPVVRATGGLADTVVDASLGDEATGFVFQEATPAALGSALSRAVALYRQEPRRWIALQRQAMAQRHGWRGAALEYLKVYQGLL